MEAALAGARAEAARQRRRADDAEAAVASATAARVDMEAENAELRGVLETVRRRRAEEVRTLAQEAAAAKRRPR
jgi:hypothetical protein